MNGLAPVTKGEQTGNINALGEEIFFWAVK